MPAAGSPHPPELPSELATLDAAAAIEAESSLLEAELSGESWPGLEAKDVSIKASLPRLRPDRRRLPRRALAGVRAAPLQLSAIEHVSGLRGASLEWPQIVELAGVWAAELGIGVLDQDDDEPRG